MQSAMFLGAFVIRVSDKSYRLDESLGGLYAAVVEPGVKSIKSAIALKIGC